MQNKMLKLDDARIAIIGLGYVGLPLAVAFGNLRSVVGYDINEQRVLELKAGVDSTLEVEAEALSASEGLSFSSRLEDIKNCNVFIITVPTPIDSARRPDFDPLLKSSATIGSILKRGDLVIYESTVYPGVTEEVCVPVLERASGLKFNEDFFCGYSPERINPGDKARTVTQITKVTSGSTAEVATFVDELYASVIVAGTHKATSIRVAEAAKVIENTQRDVNIALMNELARIFDRIGIDTQEVLAAARTKWNFMPFSPGLVGGHCIGVDPYYLAHKAAMLGYNPELILAARRINDEMASHVVARVLKLMARNRINIISSRILVQGLSFKENCPDIRNTKVIDMVRELDGLSAEVVVHDPWVDADAAKAEFGIDLVQDPPAQAFDVVILAVPHHQYLDGGTGLDTRRYLKPGGLIFDIKGALDKADDVFRL